MSPLNSHDKFGQFILAKRKARGITQKKIADALGITSAYLCDIEKGRRNPPNDKSLLMLQKLLMLSEEEVETFYDVAAISRHSVPLDLSEYVMSSETIRRALRIAKVKATQDDWMKFMQTLS